MPIVLGTARALIAAPTADQQIPAAVAFEAVAIGALPVAFLAAVLGLVAMGSEYTDDVLSGTFTVSPRRRLVVAAKCLPVLSASFLASLIGLAVAGAIAIALLASRDHTDLPVAQVGGIVVAGAVSAALTSVLGVASAALMRSLVGASVQLACVLALAPPAIGIAGGPAVQWLINVLPATAIQAVVTREPATPFTIEGAPPSTLPWWGGMVVLVVWVLGYLTAALVRIGRRAVLSPESPRRPRKHSTGAAATDASTGLRPANVLRSEVLKLLTLPGARWLLGLSVIVVVTTAVLRTSSLTPQDVLTEPVLPGDLALVSEQLQAQAISGGIGLVQLLVAFLGVIVFTSEFSTGNIRPTLIAVPRRSLLLLTKLGVVVVAAACAAIVAYSLAAVLATTFQQRMGFDVALNAPIVPETILRCTLATALVAGIGCAFGVLLRTPIAAISAIVAVFVLSHTALGPLQVLTRGTPLVWLANLDEVFPSAAIAVQNIPANAYWPHFLVGDVLQLDPSQSMMILCVWAVAGGLAGILVFRRRGA
ncbi:MAG: hypothetical protein WA006_07670 [Rhodoglobus sp.]